MSIFTKDDYHRESKKTTSKVYMKKIKLPKSMKSSENMIHCPACCTQRMTDTGRLVRGKKTFHKIKKICSNCGFRLGR